MMYIRNQFLNRTGKLFLHLLPMMVTCSLLCGCGNTDSQNDVIRASDSAVEANVNSAFHEEAVTVKIPGVTTPYTFLYLSDLHIIADLSQISEDNTETVAARRESFRNQDGIYSANLWDTYVQAINDSGTSAVLFGGDMVDYGSEANINCLKTGLDKLTIPYLYARADHDYATWYGGGLTDEYVRGLHSTIDGDPAVSYLEYPEFILLSVDNTTSDITETAYEQILAVFEKGKPIILITHVPLNSLVDHSLDKKSREVWGDRNLTWGTGCYYEPYDTTARFLNLITQQNTQVVEILSGHLHFTWDGYITNEVHEHVFSAAYDDYMGVITVTGTAQ